MADRLVLAWVVFLVACGGTGQATPDGLERQVLVSAAASLTEAFAEIEAAFEAAHPGVDVVLNLGASSTLREQIISGAPVDVFAAANIQTMAAIVSAGRSDGEAVVFAHNSLEIAVPAGNPGGVGGLADFARRDLLIGLCAKGVPCGEFARQLLTAAGVTPVVDTNEANVRALLTKIELGELDAGIVYTTDVMSASGVHGLEIPEGQNVRAEYPMTVLAGAPHPRAAAAFLAFVVSAEGRRILAEYGFASP